MSVYDPTTIPTEIFEQCFNLFERNMKEMYPLSRVMGGNRRYKKSSFGWSVRFKKNEMKEPATRYIVLSSNHKVQGFVTWQICLEEDDITVYWFLPQCILLRECVSAMAGLIVATNYNSPPKYKDPV
jgi:hypothetical protein